VIVVANPKVPFGNSTTPPPIEAAYAVAALMHGPTSVTALHVQEPKSIALIVSPLIADSARGTVAPCAVTFIALTSPVEPVPVMITVLNLGFGYVCALAGAASNVRAKRMRLIM
jgi:hypothetical protein